METQMAIALQEELKDALKAHGDWKLHLQRAVRRRETDIAVGEIRCDSCCRFGQWLNSLPSILRTSRDGREVEKLHAAFHACAGEIAEHVSRGEFDKAFSALNGREYKDLSERLATALSRWHIAAA